MEQYSVLITNEADRDIEDLYDYIANKDSIDSANYVLDGLEKLILSLNEIPKRGHFPSELQIQGIKEYREVLFKPYRVIYEIVGQNVIVHLCVDGRRDMNTLLERRLMR